MYRNRNNQRRKSSHFYFWRVPRGLGCYFYSLHKNLLTHLISDHHQLSRSKGALLSIALVFAAPLPCLQALRLPLLRKRVLASMVERVSPDPAKPNAAMARKRRKSVVADFEMAIAEEVMKGAGENTSARSLELVRIQELTQYSCRGRKKLDPQDRARDDGTLCDKYQGDSCVFVVRSASVRLGFQKGNRKWSYQRDLNGGFFYRCNSGCIGLHRLC